MKYAVSLLVILCVVPSVNAQRQTIPEDGWGHLVKEENNLSPQERALCNEIAERNLWFERMANYGDCDFYPKHYRSGQSVSRWHRAERERKTGVGYREPFDGPFVTNDWSLMKMPADLKKEHHNLYWSMIRKLADRGWVIRKFNHSSYKKRITGLSTFFDAPNEKIKTIEKNMNADRKATVAFLKGKPPKLPGVPFDRFNDTRTLARKQK